MGLTLFMSFFALQFWEYLPTQASGRRQPAKSRMLLLIFGKNTHHSLHRNESCWRGDQAGICWRKVKKTPLPLLSFHSSFCSTEPQINTDMCDDILTFTPLIFLFFHWDRPVLKAPILTTYSQRIRPLLWAPGGAVPLPKLIVTRGWCKV